MRLHIAVTYLAGLIICSESTAADFDLADDNAKVNYSVGYQIGNDFKVQEIEIRKDALLKGIQDALIESNPMMSAIEMRDTMMELGKRASELRKKRHQDIKQKMLEDNHKFLAANASLPGVTTTDSGLQYKVIKAGKGKTPSIIDRVTINYSGHLIDGSEFDSTYTTGKPLQIQLTDVIPGWQEALQMMKEGAIWQLFIPPELAYGSEASLANQILIYEVELITVN